MDYIVYGDAATVGVGAVAVVIWVFVLLIGILLHVLCAYIVSQAVVKKGYKVAETHAFAKCFWLGFVGYIYVLALPDRILQEQNRKIMDALQKTEKG